MANSFENRVYLGMFFFFSVSGSLSIKSEGSTELFLSLACLALESDEIVDRYLNRCFHWVPSM